MFSLFDFEITTKKLLLLLAPFDLFKQNVSLKLHSNFRVSLTIGKIFSFAVIVFMLYNFVESDMVQRTNPIVLQQSFEEDQRLTLNFTSKNILMVFGVTDDYNLIYDDPTIFNITSSKVIVVNGSKSTFIDSKLEKCKTNHFERYPDFLTKMNMNGTKCLSDDFNLQGFWDESYLEFFVIEVKKCQNSSFSSIVCKSNEEIVNYMKGKFFSQWVEQKRFDVKNPDNPISGKIKNYYNAYQPGQTKSTRFFLKKVKLITDSGIIFSSSTEENSFALDKLEYDVTPSETHFFTFVAYASDNSLTIERRYEKLFDLFASLGGLLNVLFIVASMIVEFIHDWKLNELVLNKLYVFINSNQKRLNKAISKIPMNFASSRVAPTSKRQINIDRNSMSLNFEYQNKLSMTLYEKTKLFFRKKKKMSEKEKLYYDYSKKTNVKLDFLNLLQRLEEIEKIKLILFDERQQILFNTITKRQISAIHAKDTKKFNIDIKNLSEDQTLDLKKLFNEKDSLPLDSLDRKLVDLVF